jgi:hypothetical protein
MWHMMQSRELFFCGLILFIVFDRISYDSVFCVFFLK